MPEPGAIRALGHWPVEAGSRLGGGGYAQAFRSRNPALYPGECAIKVFDNLWYANTFEREVAALQGIEGCPGTPALVDHGRDEAGRLCIVTALAPGQRLDKWLRTQGPLELPALSGLLAQLLQVLACAHGRGWLHKDIKTSNILVDGARCTLLDWGVAEPVGDGRAESIRAKQDYVAPECYHGRHGLATDFYSLGWLIVEALSGQRPYQFDTIRERDYRVVAHCLERPAVPALPEPWGALARAWIAKEPERRPVGYELDALLVRAHQEAPTDPGGVLDPRNVGRQCDFLEQAARADIPWAANELGQRLLKDGRIEEGRHWLEAAAAAGHAGAAWRLGRLFERGEAGPRDAGRAREWMTRAAHSGHAGACHRLSRLLRAAGEADEADRWLARAAELGNARAQYEHGRALERQPGRFAEALAWIRCAADRGHEDARARLSRLLHKEPGDPALRGLNPFWEKLAVEPAPSGREEA
ncbi:MAG: protein kinase [Rhodocyclaceae bacterium]|nr:protein kinase [Rhodocyclaceae bacterium]